MKENLQVKTRDSGIEFLKIMAIILIIISHVTQTLSTKIAVIPFSDYVIDLSTATTNIQYFILTLFRYFGVLGNSVFFVCSAWFLLRSEKFEKKKCFSMIVEVWIISLIILIISLILGTNISIKHIIKCLLPITFGTNWYVTCYLLFYAIHPLLNKIISSLSKRNLFRIATTMFILYFGFNFIKDIFFFPSRIILWITIYFVMAYMQLYMKDFANDIKKNVIIIVVCVCLFLGLALVTNYLEFHISFFHDKMLHWTSHYNPILTIMAIAMFNVARNIHFKNRVINYISSLSLLIYLIHENLILSTYFRPYMINYVYTNYGYDNILLWVLVLVIIIFAFSLMCSFIYDKTLRQLVKKVSTILYSVVSKIYLKIENVLLRIH